MGHTRDTLDALAAAAAAKKATPSIELQFAFDLWERADALRRRRSNFQRTIEKRPTDWDDLDIDSHRVNPPERDDSPDHC